MGLPYLRLFTGDYLKDTRDLSSCEHGIYLLLMFYQWDTGRGLPLDLERLATIVNARTKADHEALKRILGRFFTRKADGYHNRRIDHELAHSEIVREGRQRGGYARAALLIKAEPDDQQMQSKCTANAEHLECISPASDPASDLLRARASASASASAPPPTSTPAPPTEAVASVGVEKTPSEFSLVGLAPDDARREGKTPKGNGPLRSTKALNVQAREVLAMLNQATGRDYQPVEANLKLVRARLEEFDLQTVKDVVATKCDEWRADAEMAKYLRPATLFNAQKFAQYAGQLPRQRNA